MKLTSFLPLLAGCASIPGVLAWGAAGHEIIATIAQIYLHPSVLPSLCTILNFHSTNPDEPQCHLAPIASWADRIRFRERWSAPLHYVGALDDYPSQTCAFPGARGWAGRDGANVLGALRNDSNILEEWSSQKSSASDDLANEALKFFVHFVGDMHQPLHLTGRDRGGNSDKVSFDGRTTNLHSLWDGLLIAKAIRLTPYNYTRSLPIEEVEFNLRGAIYDPYIRRIIWEGLLQEWKEEIPEWLACPANQSNAQTLPRVTSSSFFASMLNTVIDATEVVLSYLTPDSPGDSTDDDAFCPFYWASSIHELNCEIVWPKALDETPHKTGRLQGAHEQTPCKHASSPEAEVALMDAQGRFIGGEDVSADANDSYLELDTPEYSGVITQRKIVEKLLAQAGIRLAATLNYLFADEEAGHRLDIYQSISRV